MKEERLRSLIRSYLMHEGFKVGDLSNHSDGDQIPLSWDPEDVHFVRKSRDGGAYTSDDKFSSEFGGVFPIRSAFAFQENAPSRDNDAYPSHLEDVLEALKGKQDTVYTIPERDMQNYISDGTKIVARSIIDDIDKLVKEGKLPVEVKDARISIYVTPSSSRHVSDYVEGLRSSLERYIGSRFDREKKDLKSNFSKNAYRECAEELKAMFDSFFKSGGRSASYFYEPYSNKDYKEAVNSAREQARRRVEAEKQKPGTFPRDALSLYMGVLRTINKYIKSMNEFIPPDVSTGRLSSTDIDINRSFRKIPVSQDPGIQADQTIVRQFTKQIGGLARQINPDAGSDASEIDLSRVQKSQLNNLSPFIKKRWNAWKKQGISSRLTVEDLIADFEAERRGDIPDWQKRMLAAKKTDFSISVVPSQNRRHVSDFIEADTSTLPTFLHIAIIADDNMESGITLREMRRVFDRIRTQSNPPIMIYGAPLLAIRGQEGREYTHEKNYTGRRKSKLPVAAPLSNIPVNSVLYKKIENRIKSMVDPNFEISEPEEGSGEV